MSEAGRSFLVGLVGAGIATSLTPALHQAEGRALGLSYVYRSVDLTALGIETDRIGELVRAARAFGFDALNITHPCKQTVIDHLDRLDSQAERIGAVNTVIFGPDGAVGYNTDASGFRTAFSTGLPGAGLTNVVLIGAGGAGAAVADALLSLGARRLIIIDVDRVRRERLAARLSLRFPSAEVGAGDHDQLAAASVSADGLVHCTPTGMAAHPGLALDPALLHAGLWVADVVYRPLRTALIGAAEAAGARTLSGGLMAVHQAVDTIRLVTGHEPDAARMVRHFDQLITEETMTGGLINLP